MGQLPVQALVLVPAETAVYEGMLCPEAMGSSFLRAHPALGGSPKENTKPEWLSPAPSQPWLCRPSMLVLGLCPPGSEHGIIQMGMVPGQSHAPSRASHKGRMGSSGLYPS